MRGGQLSILLYIPLLLRDLSLNSRRSGHQLVSASHLSHCQLAPILGSTGVQAGAIFVDAAAENYLRKALTNAGLDSSDVDEYTKAGVKDFEGFAKRAFSDETKEHSIAIAHSRFNNTSIKTRRGRMTIPGLVSMALLHQQLISF